MYKIELLEQYRYMVEQDRFIIEHWILEYIIIFIDLSKKKNLKKIKQVGIE